mgnify:CR=1 FL=1
MGLREKIFLTTVLAGLCAVNCPNWFALVLGVIALWLIWN